MNPHEEAVHLILSIKNELLLGTKHFDKDDTTTEITDVKTILELLQADRLLVQPTPERRHLFEVH